MAIWTGKHGGFCKRTMQDMIWYDMSGSVLYRKSHILWYLCTRLIVFLNQNKKKKKQFLSLKNINIDHSKQA